MAKPPDCSHCQKPATIHLTQIINNEIKKLDFCEGCPHQKGVTDPAGFSLAELLAQADPGSIAGEAASEQTCDSCGFTPGDFKQTGRLGCPDCYEHLAAFIEPMLERMHRDTRHTGKVPAELIERLRRQARRAEMERALAKAIAEERFEEAARLRDEIHSLPGDAEAGKVTSAESDDS